MTTNFGSDVTRGKANLCEGWDMITAPRTSSEVRLYRFVLIKATKPHTFALLLLLTAPALYVLPLKPIACVHAE